jgi:hypothetical protein
MRRHLGGCQLFVFYHWNVLPLRGHLSCRDTFWVSPDLRFYFIWWFRILLYNNQCIVNTKVYVLNCCFQIKEVHCLSKVFWNLVIMLFCVSPVRYFFIWKKYVICDLSVFVPDTFISMVLYNSFSPGLCVKATISWKSLNINLNNFHSDVELIQSAWFCTGISSIKQWLQLVI